jgi:hypothetical protein
MRVKFVGCSLSLLKLGIDKLDHYPIRGSVSVLNLHEELVGLLG